MKRMDLRSRAEKRSTLATISTQRKNKINNFQTKKTICL